MESVIDILGNAVVIGVLLWRIKPNVVTVVPEDPTVPPMGTIERKEYHREQRDYHQGMLLEAGKAARMNRPGQARKYYD